MFKPTAALVEVLREFIPSIDDGALSAELEVQASAKRGDLTAVLLGAARAAQRREVALPRPVEAAACRAGCRLLAARHPGASVEVRVPPFAAVQVGFGAGPRHTRGTPPAVVEMTPAAFLGLATGCSTWDQVAVSRSGAHAEQVAEAFPLLG